MRIESLHIKNLRSFKNEIIHFDDYTCLVGPNGAGKSTVLFALNVFFREPSVSAAGSGTLAEEDFHGKSTYDPIEITVTFGDIEATAASALKHYVRGGKLVVTAKASFNPETRGAKVEQYGERNVMPGFRAFFRAYDDNAKAEELKKLYADMQRAYPDLPRALSKDAMRDALREYEESHPDLCELTPSADEFYGFTKGTNKLEPFIQWVFVPAVKDATGEQAEAKNTALAALLDRTVRSKVKFDEEVKRVRDQAREDYQKMLDRQQSALEDISESLTKRVAMWAHPDASVRLIWREDPRSSIRIDEPSAWLRAGESGFESDLTRFGHGLQRCYILALLQELALSGAGEGPRLVLGCEEPELYQHPPQARHLSDVLDKLSEENCQVIITTHSPLFVTGERFEAIRIVRRSGASPSTVRRAMLSEVGTRLKELTGTEYRKVEGAQAKLHSALQPHLSEMFFATRVVLVEGIEDAAYMTAYLTLTNRWVEFRRRGGHIVPAGGKGHLLRAAVVAEILGIPHFVVFDGDGDMVGKPNQAQHEKDNRALLHHKGKADGCSFPRDPFFADEIVVWPLDLRRAVRTSGGADAWGKIEEHVRAEFGHMGDMEKNPLFIGSILARAAEEKILPPILETLAVLLENFIARA